MSAISGARALVADETLAAVFALLVAAEVVPPERASDALGRLAGRLRDHGTGAIESEWRIEPRELALQVERIDALAETIAGQRNG